MEIAAIIFDFGDTLADESTEEKDSREVTQRAELFPGALETILGLEEQGYVLGLLADSVPGTGRETYSNVLGQHQIDHCFDALVTSDDVGVSKPDPRMFLTILNELGIPERDGNRVVMVGNRLDRDIAGANDLGLTTVWADLTERYRREPVEDRERPDFTFASYSEFPLILDQIKRADQ
jgi:FMN phosphatase YigB (HAD superfamily)